MSAAPSPVRLELHRDGGLALLRLDRPPGNVLDTAMVEAIAAQLPALAARPGLRLLVFAGEGRHFSFGASVAEHLPEQVGRMLPAFHELFRALEATSLPTAALLRGQCLGGAAELALVCGRVVAEPGATIGFPEVKLAVFPPVAAVALPLRVGAARAVELVCTGRGLAAAEAVAWGLVDELAEDAWAALLAWYDRHLAPLSPAALRLAWRASRGPWRRALAEELPAAERLYLDELMAHPDAVEGLRAFLEKRPPAWSRP